MSARSPRGSLSGASSDEVADDFGESLKDLQANNRYEISNLTIIAKENTEHAQAISKTLESHIKTIAPNRKLPALYVLDSIVKNVGTPYTVYLGRNLYSTFMEAYTLVDANTRRNMEGMLKTWKEPVPGSMEARPVFPVDTVRPIENALIKARTAAVHGGRQVQNPPRNTPTPPQHNGRAVPSGQGQPYGYGFQHHAFNQQGVPSIFSPAPNAAQSSPYAAPPNDVETIKRDVASLISQHQAQLGANPYDAEVQKRLNALLQLQTLLNSNSQTLDASSLQQIRNQISALAASGGLPSRSTPQPSYPSQQQWQPPPTASQPPHLAMPPAPYSQPSSTKPQSSAPFLDPAALSGLQALLANGQKPGTPQIRAAAPALQQASHSQLSSVQNQTSSSPAINGNDLIAALTKNGLLPSASNPTPPAASAPPPQQQPQQQSTASLLQSLQGVLAPPTTTTTPTHRPRIPMTAASLKTFRPDLLHTLYAAQPNQCTTCGRRFPASEPGRAQKARHLDWHFRTNQRMADTSLARGGAHRDWFPTEIAWIAAREFDPSTTTTQPKEEKKEKKEEEEKFVRAPAGVTKNVCGICFEEMKSTFAEGVQDWVFGNATRYGGGKIVHASCLAEMVKGSSSNSSLGRKRKAGERG